MEFMTIEKRSAVRCSVNPQAHKNSGLDVRHLQVVLLYFFLASSTIMDAMVGVAEPLNTDFPTGDLEAEVRYYGYTLLEGVSSIISGWLVSKISNAFLFRAYGVVSLVLVYAMPLTLMNTGWKGFIALRYIHGLLLGLVYPLAFSSMTQWIPKEELDLLVPVIMSGRFFGYCFVRGMAADVARSSNGWSAIYYLAGNFTLIWFLLYLGLGASQPSSCWYISRREREYIERNVECLGTYRRQIPYSAFIRNVPAWGLIAAFASKRAVFTTMGRTTSDVLKKKYLRTKNTGILNCGSLFLPVISVFLTAPLMRYLTKKNLLARQSSPLVANSIGYWIMGACMLLASNTETLISLVVFHCVGKAFYAFSFSGIYMNVFHLAPNYAGSLKGWTWGVGRILSILVSFSFRRIEKYQVFEVAWRALHLCFGISLILGNLAFIMFGSAGIQSFNQLMTYEEGSFYSQ